VLFAYRLWTRQATMRDSRKAFGLTKEAAIMAESGAIYLITIILIIEKNSTETTGPGTMKDLVANK
jgi:hypothetical protein